MYCTKSGATVNNEARGKSHKMPLLIGAAVLVIAIVAVILSRGSGLSGTYTSESGYYSVSFDSKDECTWYQSGLSFEGSYEKSDDGYRLEIGGGGWYADTVFDAVVDDGDLIVTGGVVYGERFVKQ
ncbi:MAG: hypothetical protein LUC98_01005 [Lachnospiraceae bacterium]|nr:hypothetical protein [Lachnospiraceae bacterium]